MEYFAL
jgi:hypothetical protein